MSFPSVSASSSASGKLDQTGAAWSLGSGDFTVNVSGSGKSDQNATTGLGVSTPVLIIGALVVVWLLTRR